MNLRVSVVIPNYNYARFLGICIDSLLSQTVLPDEIIVVDDGSSDNSREVMESYGDKIIPIFQPNGGQASAISAGFARATGDIVCILDSDDLFFKDKIEILKNVYQANPRAGWVFHDLKHLTVEEASGGPLKTAGTPLAETIDARKSMAEGSLSYDAPATSGLTFRKSFIDDLFPLPLAKSIYISDHYIKFYALAKGEGISISEALGGQIIHGNNLYTGTKVMATRARIFTSTANCLLQKRPDLKKFCVNLAIEGYVCARKAGIENEVSVREILQDLSPVSFWLARLKIFAKSLLKKIQR